MFEELRKSDIDEALSLLMHAAHRKAREAKDRINLEAMQASAFQSNRVIFVIAEEINKIHIDSIEEAKKILLDFIPRMRKPATTITGWARPHLENLSNTIIGVVPPNGFPADRERAVRQYQAVFQQRIDLALRNVDIGYSKGAGFAARDAMPQEEWISAAEAVALLGPKIGEMRVREAICNRAESGLVRARAIRFVRGKAVSDNADVPSEMWWAKGKGALTQDWKTGDFSTWVDRDTVQLRAFGVTFHRADIEAMIPPSTQQVPPAVADVATTSKQPGGRPPAGFWDDLWIEIFRQIWAGDLQPKSQADIVKAMLDWITSQGKSSGETAVKERARKFWAMYAKMDEN